MTVKVIRKRDQGPEILRSELMDGACFSYGGATRYIATRRNDDDCVTTLWDLDLGVMRLRVPNVQARVFSVRATLEVE